MTGKTDRERRVDLYLCAEPQFGAENQKQAVVDRLNDLERDDKIDEFGTYIWGREIRPTGPLEGTDYHRSVLESLQKFEDWLRDNGASADRLFNRREVDSAVVDESYTVISLPTMCLAVYEGGDLSGVYPYADDEGSHTVRECLAELEASERSVAIDGIASGR